jgi:myosin heavy subunit
MIEGQEEDLVLMKDICAEGIQAILAARFLRQEMYTAIGPVLIAVNPYW